MSAFDVFKPLRPLNPGGSQSGFVSAPVVLTDENGIVFTDADGVVLTYGTKRVRPIVGLYDLQQLFTADDKAALFDFSTTANLHQDPDATIAPGVGNPIGRMNDVSGKGLNAVQATTANMPTLRQTPTTGRYWLESIDANRALNITTPSVYGTMYVGRVTPEGMVWSTQNWSTTTVNVLGGQGSYSAGMVARGREFTAAEKALVEAYFTRQLPTLGPNLLVNPGFDADSGWTKGSGWSIANGVATANKAAGVAAADLSQNVQIVGKLYLIKMTVTRFGSGAPYYTAIGAAFPSYNIWGGATCRVVGYAIGNGFCGPRHGGTAATDFDVDNVSQREIL